MEEVYPEPMLQLASTAPTVKTTPDARESIPTDPFTPKVFYDASENTNAVD